jgi:hypothetical protein
VFISEYSRRQWGWRDGEAVVINHGIDQNVFKTLDFVQKKPVILSVVNDFINRDYFCGFSLWREVTAGLPVKPLGKTPGLSMPAASVEDLVLAYNEAQIFINTSLVSPIPTSLLEAMACGAACVSTATCMIPEIIKNGHNGYCTNDPREMRYLLEKLLADPKECARLGANARDTISKDFSMGDFVANWDGLLRNAANIVTVKGTKPK